MTAAHKVEHITSNDCEIENVNLKTPSKFRQTLPQCAAIAAKNLLLLTFGSTIGFATILIPALQDENSEIKITSEELTWIGSINYFVLPLGCLISGPISERFGRRRVMMLLNIPYVISWLIFYFANSAAWLFVALVITGLCGGISESPILTYVTEVTQTHLRGILSGTSVLSSIVGVFTQMLTGNFVGWRTVCLFNLIYPVTCFFALSAVPESPFWLAGKGRLEDAKKSLSWLRGWVEPIQVTDEFQAICENVSRNRQSSTTKQKEFPLSAYLKRTFYIPFILVSFCFIAVSFGGCANLQTYAVVIFADLNAPIDKYTATVILGLAQLAGTLIFVCTTHIAGRRKLTFFSLGGSGLCFFLAAIYGFSIKQQMVDEDSYTWIPTSLMIGAAFITHTGIRLVPWILMAELFPSNVRSCASGMAGALGYLLTSVSNKIFFYTTNGLTLSGTFLFYGVVNLICITVLYFFMPETEGRTLTEIENHYAGIKSLNDKPSDKSK